MALTRPLARLLCAASLAGATALGVGAPPATAAPDPAPAATSARAVTVVDTGAAVASGFEVAKDGRVLYGGPSDPSVHVWSPSTGRSAVFATVPRGKKLLGLTLHPQFPATPYVYVTAVVATAQGQRIQLGRFTASGATGGGYRLLRDLAPFGTDHSGGKITFTPDGKHLVLVIGDGGDTPESAQDLRKQSGKVLRVTPLGAPAPGNPFGSAVYAYGFRNSIGLAFDPANGNLWETENGPDCGDELNRVRAGGNFAWGPSATCTPLQASSTNRDGADRLLPARWYARSSAPTGAEFCSGCGLTGAQGGLLYGRFLQQDIRLVTLNAARTGVAAERTLYAHSDAVLGIERDPRDGAIWFSDFGSIRRLTD